MSISKIRLPKTLWLKNRNIHLEYRKPRFLSKNVDFCKIRFFVIIFQQKPQIKIFMQKNAFGTKKVVDF